MSPGVILLIILIIILIGAVPAWPHSQAWGPWPGGLIGVVLLVVLILVLAGRL